MNNYPYQQMNMQLPYQQARPTYMDMVQQQMQYMGIKGRPVASFDEAKASMIDFDGSVFYFPDTANQRIYTKQINLDGTSSLKVYALVENQIPQNQSPIPPVTNLENMVTKEEFNSTVENLMREIQQMKGAMTKNDESVGNDVSAIQF